MPRTSTATPLGPQGDPNYRYHNSDDGDEARDGRKNLGWTGPQPPIQLLPSSVDKHHFELLPPVLAQVAAEQ
jgi:hypothetical protein